MWIQKLTRTRLGKRYGGDGIKYFVDCTDSTNSSTCEQIKEQVTNERVLYSKSPEEPAILQSIFEYSLKNHTTSKSKSKTKRRNPSTSSTTKRNVPRNTLSRILKKTPIVIKTGFYGQGYVSIYKEFDIGRQLRDIPGFIRYIAYLTCYDESCGKDPSSSSSSSSSRSSKRGRQITLVLKDTKICRGGDDVKELLLMPYYAMSMGTYEWDETLSASLVSLFQQIVWSSYTAFVKYGFLHQDMHLHNFMVEQTMATTIRYEIPNPNGTVVEIDPHGYQVVIMDFERSTTNTYGSTSENQSRDVSSMLRNPTHSSQTQYQELYAKVQRQKQLWADYRRLFHELDDIRGVHCSGPGPGPGNESLEIHISNFIKKQMDTFSKTVIYQQNLETEYQRRIQELYRICLNDQEQKLSWEELDLALQQKLYVEISKLSNYISQLEFVNA